MATTVMRAFAHDQGRRGLRPRTIENRRRVLWSLQNHLDPAAITKATTEDIERWLDCCHLTSKRSKYTYISSVASFFEFCVRTRALKANPTVDILRPRLGRMVPRPACAEDVEHAIDVADSRMALWLSLAAYQGLRCVEIAQLRREDVWDHQAPALLFIEGKGGRQDLAPLNLSVETALRRYGMPRCGPLFTSILGRPYPAGTISTYGNRYLRELEINARMHMLRHLFGSTVWKRTKDLRVTQEAMRHADPRTTAGYTAFDEEVMNRVLRNLTLHDAALPALGEAS